MGCGQSPPGWACEVRFFLSTRRHIRPADKRLYKLGMVTHWAGVTELLSRYRHAAHGGCTSRGMLRIRTDVFLAHETCRYIDPCSLDPPDRACRNPPRSPHAGDQPRPHRGADPYRDGKTAVLQRAGPRTADARAAARPGEREYARGPEPAAGGACRCRGTLAGSGIRARWYTDCNRRNVESGHYLLRGYASVSRGGCANRSGGTHPRLCGTVSHRDADELGAIAGRVYRQGSAGPRCLSRRSSDHHGVCLPRCHTPGRRDFDPDSPRRR